MTNSGKKSDLPVNKTTVNEIKDVNRKDEVEIVSDKDLMDMVNTSENFDEHTETEQETYLEKDFQNSNDKKSSGGQNYDENELDSPGEKDNEQKNKTDIKTEEEIFNLQKFNSGDNTNDVLAKNISQAEKYSDLDNGTLPDKPAVNNDEKYHTTQNENDSDPVYGNFEENDPDLHINENIIGANQEDKLFSHNNEELSINVHTNETETSHQNFNKHPNSSSIELEKSREDENHKPFDNINEEKVQNDIFDDNKKSNNITSDESKAASLISDAFDYLANILSGVTQVSEEEFSEVVEQEKLSDSNIKNDSVKINESNSSTNTTFNLPLENSISDDSPKLPVKSSVLKPFDLL